MLYKVTKNRKSTNQHNVIELAKTITIVSICIGYSIYLYQNLPIRSVIEHANTTLFLNKNNRFAKESRHKKPLHPSALIKREIDIKSTLGVNYAESINYLHNIKHNTIDWTSALPLFSPPYAVRKAGAYSFLHDNLEHYSTYNGDQELRKAIIDKFHRDRIFNINEENIIVHTSVFEIIDAIYDALKLSTDESILIPTPTFGYYASQANKHNIKVKFISATQKTGWKIQPHDLDEALTQTNAKIFLFTNPVNPTGAVYTKEEVEKLANILKKHKTLVLSDEVFKDILLYDDQKPYSIGAVDGMKDLTVTLNGVGKSMGLAGLRVSYACMPEWLNKALSKPLCGLSKPAEKAAAVALQDTEENHKYLKQTAYSYKERLQTIKSLTKSIDKVLRHKFNPYSSKEDHFARLYIEPKATNVVLLSFPGIKGKFFGSHKIETGLQLASYLAQNAGVALVPGEASFMGEHEMILRIPLAANNLKQGFEKIKKALLQLHN